MTENNLKIFFTDTYQLSQAVSYLDEINIGISYV